MSVTVETAKLPMLLNALRLPTFARLWPEFGERADAEGWPTERLLAALCELELRAREQRRVQRHLAAAKLAPGKTLDSFDFSVVPTMSQAKVRALAEGDSWLQPGHNLLGFVPLSKTGAEFLFELISQGCERGATLITSNLPFDEWTETFGTERLTGALLDRLTLHVNILEMNGESYRLAQSRARKSTDTA
jgi:DNA replication protein DnaC